MKTAKLLLVAGSPVLIGLFWLLLPSALASHLSLSILMLAYWLWAGTFFGQHVAHPARAILTTHALGIIALMVYVWQFRLVSGESRIMPLAALSQLFSGPLSRLSAIIALILQSGRGDTTPDTLLLMQINGLLLMLVAFSVGYFLKRHRQKMAPSTPGR